MKKGIGNEIRKRVVLTLGIGFILILMFYFITGAITKYTGYSVSPALTEKTDFETCLERQEIILYIQSEDSGETLRNIINFEYLKNIKFVNCLKNLKGCIAQEVNDFPTWIINENKISGDISIGELVEFSGCKF